MHIVTLKELIGLLFVAVLVMFTVIVCTIGSKEKEHKDE